MNKQRSTPTCHNLRTSLGTAQARAMLKSAMSPQSSKANSISGGLIGVQSAATKNEYTLVGTKRRQDSKSSESNIVGDSHSRQRAPVQQQQQQQQHRVATLVLNIATKPGVSIIKDSTDNPLKIETLKSPRQVLSPQTYYASLTRK